MECDMFPQRHLCPIAWACINVIAAYERKKDAVIAAPIYSLLFEYENWL